MVRIKNLKVAFIHPDLGIGGAERLILDVAIALADQGVQILFVTNHFDKKHAFEELKSDKYRIRVIGDWIPRSLCGRFQALFAYIRMVYLSLIYLLFLRHIDKPDIYFVDQIPMSVPFIKLVKERVIYYCHHPDLLASSHNSKLKRIYRYPIDWLETYGTSKSDLLLVNSQYTANVFKHTFNTLERKIEILYPTIALSYQKTLGRIKPNKLIQTLIPEITANDCTVFLSINRFHPAKRLELAIGAMECLQTRLSSNDWDKIYLIMAGGYDPQSDVNAKYFNKLVKLVDKKKLNVKVIFLKSPSDNFKAELLLASNCLIYTPVNEHFGIVPLEAMTASKPVIACNSGGPCETVENNITGYLCKPTPEDMANSMYKIFANKVATKSMGENGKKRLENKFSYQQFHDQVMDIVLRGIGCSTVIDSSKFSTTESGLGVIENKEKRKSFDFRANISILPDIIEDMEEENEIDDVPDNCSKTNGSPTDQNNRIEHSFSFKTNIEEVQVSSEDSKIEDSNIEISVTEYSNIEISETEDFKDDSKAEDFKTEDFNPEDFKSEDTKIEDSLIENEEYSKTEEAHESVKSEIEKDSNLEFRKLDESQEKEVSYNTLEIIENLIESERKHSNITTPIKFPIRRYPASLCLNVDLDESKLLNDSVDVTDISMDIENV